MILPEMVSVQHAVEAAVVAVHQQAPRALGELDKASQRVLARLRERLGRTALRKLANVKHNHDPVKRILVRFAAAASPGRRSIDAVAYDALETATRMVAEGKAREEIAEAVFRVFWFLGAGSLPVMKNVDSALNASRAAVAWPRAKKKHTDPRAIVRAVFTACGYTKPLFG